MMAKRVALHPVKSRAPPTLLSLSCETTAGWPGICARTGKAPDKPGPAGPLTPRSPVSSSAHRRGRWAFSSSPAGRVGGSGAGRWPLSLGNASEGVFPPRSLVVSSYLSSRFQGRGKPQMSGFRRQGTVTEPLLYFPIWSAAPAGSGSIIIYDAAEGRRPRKPHSLESPSLYQLCAHRWLRAGGGEGRRQRVDASASLEGGGGGVWAAQAST